MIITCMNIVKNSKPRITKQKLKSQLLNGKYIHAKEAKTELITNKGGLTKGSQRTYLAPGYPSEYLFVRQEPNAS